MASNYTKPEKSIETEESYGLLTHAHTLADRTGATE